MEVTRNQLEGFAAQCRRAAAQGLMRCSSGNMSQRLDPDTMLVKASRSWMESLIADQIAVCRISDGAPLNGRTPSVEIGFHSGVLRARPDVNVVLHFQSPAATTLACSRPETVDFMVLPEIPYYIGPIGIVPYIQPGSPELAAAVVDVMKTHNLAVLSNHGLVTCGKTSDETIQRAVFFELNCDVILRGAGNIVPLTTEAVQRLRPQSARV